MRYLFGGHAALLLAGARAVFEAEHANYLSLLDRNKGKYLWREIKRSLEDLKSTWSCLVLFSEITFSVFLNTLSQGNISIPLSIFLFRIIRSCVCH